MHNISCQAESVNDMMCLELEEQHCQGQHMYFEWSKNTYTRDWARWGKGNDSKPASWWAEYKWNWCCIISFVLDSKGETYIRYAYGTMGEAMTDTPTMITHDTIQISQNRFHIAGHSLKKWDSSTSLTVEDHCMLYPVKWASRAVVKCHERPQKKKKKKMTHYRVSMYVAYWRRALTLKLPTKALPSEFAFNRYWKIADEILDRPEKTTTPDCQVYPLEMKYTHKLGKRSMKSSRKHQERRWINQQGPNWVKTMPWHRR
jgi:hypothetical protein